MARYDTISFLSDYGRADEFVGVVHSVLRSLAPHAHVVDVNHDIPPHDVRAGALCLARAAQYLCPGVVLAVVDPGVGTARRAVAIEVGDGQSVLVGPDNGLLAPAVAMVGGAGRCVSLTDTEYQLPAPGATFAGRDVFAPAAAHLASGVDLAELGEAVDAVSLLPGVLPVTHEEDGELQCEVLWIDRYGNAQLNVDPDEIEGWGRRVQVAWDGGSRTATLVAAYGDLAPGEIGLVTDSYGLLAVSIPRSSAAFMLGLDTGLQVKLRRLDDDVAGGVVTPVELGRRS
jgi:S-adenosyl-L-methionine hydrolase (adenosine-forming)